MGEHSLFFLFGVDDGPDWMCDSVGNSGGVSTKSSQLAISRSLYTRRFPTIELPCSAILKSCWKEDILANLSVQKKKSKNYPL
jgi:hypothetical protein